MSDYPALKDRFEKKWLATWLSDNSIPEINDKNWQEVPLKERINALATQINNWLPKQTTGENIKHIDTLLSNNKPWNKGDMQYWPIFSWIELFCFESPKQSLEFLAKYTHLLTAEFAIRPIIEHNEKEVFRFLAANINNPDEHVRRWISEGTRPRLPWGTQVACLKQNLTRYLELINHLIDDESASVRKSVANHLNDVYREDTPLAMKYATRWWKHNTAHSKWIVKHGMRSAIKDGYEPALKLLGFSAVAFTQTKLIIHQKSISFDGVVQFNFEGKLNKPSDVIIDYAVHFVGSNDKPRIKVFKLKTLQKATELAIDKRHSFKPISTRKYYPGIHTISILANGKTIASETFELLAP
jgi:3-methyladenine DNA glycosylase AlkC